MLLLRWHKFQICRLFFICCEMWRSCIDVSEDSHLLGYHFLSNGSWCIRHRGQAVLDDFSSTAWPWGRLFRTSITICQYSGYNLLEDFSLQKQRSENLIIVQQDVTYSVYYIFVGSSTCFGCWHPSSGVRTTVIRASGIDISSNSTTKADGSRSG